MDVPHDAHFLYETSVMARYYAKYTLEVHNRHRWLKLLLYRHNWEFNMKYNETFLF